MGVPQNAKERAALRERALTIGDTPSSMKIYRAVRKTIQVVLFRMFSLTSKGAEHLDSEGPTILAPVHRSHLDSVLLASLSRRRIRALGKESLFTVPVVGYMCAALGAIPVQRGAADKEALLAAKALLDRGESMIVFPEGGRQSGNTVTDLFDGAAWLSARTGARVIPVGIAGTEDAMPEGAKFIHRSKVSIVVGEPMDPPQGADGKRARRDDLERFTERLTKRLQAAQDEAVLLGRELL